MRNYLQVRSEDEDFSIHQVQVEAWTLMLLTWDRLSSKRVFQGLGSYKVRLMCVRGEPEVGFIISKITELTGFMQRFIVQRQLEHVISHFCHGKSVKILIFQPCSVNIQTICQSLSAHRMFTNCPVESVFCFRLT